MGKWADYCISQVRYNPEHIHIVSVKVREDKGESLGAENEWLRSDVVSAIQNGTTFVTVVQTDHSNWKKGKEVAIITVNGTRYIRTDANSKPAENLENLPEY